jgi:hypothetical protein
MINLKVTHEAYMHDAILNSAAIVGFISAVLWWRSATLNVPTHRIRSAFGGLVGVEEVHKAMINVAHWNKWAALTSGFAVALQAFASFF